MSYKECSGDFKEWCYISESVKAHSFEVSYTTYPRTKGAIFAFVVSGLRGNFDERIYRNEFPVYASHQADSVWQLACKDAENWLVESTK